MLHDILDDDHIQWHPPLIGHYTNFWPLLIWTLLPNLTFYLIVQGFHRTYATGAACQQRTLTPPDTRSCPTLGLACVLMSRPISPELVLSPDFWISNIPWYFSFAPYTRLPIRYDGNDNFSSGISWKLPKIATSNVIFSKRMIVSPWHFAWQFRRSSIFQCVFIILVLLHVTDVKDQIQDSYLIWNKCLMRQKLWYPSVHMFYWVSYECYLFSVDCECTQLLTPIYFSPLVDGSN